MITGIQYISLSTNIFKVCFVFYITDMENSTFIGHFREKSTCKLHMRQFYFVMLESTQYSIYHNLNFFGESLILQ